MNTIRSRTVHLAAFGAALVGMTSGFSWASAQGAPVSDLAASLSTDLLDANGVPIPPGDRIYELALSWVAPADFSGQFVIVDLGPEVHPGGSPVSTLASDAREFVAEVPFPTQPICYRVEARNAEGDVLGQASVCTQAPPTTGAAPTPGAPETGTTFSHAERHDGAPPTAMVGAAIAAAAVTVLIRRSVLRQV